VKKPQQQNGFSLLQRDFEQEEISGLDGGWISFYKLP
jgi:hypothetical protein